MRLSLSAGAVALSVVLSACGAAAASPPASSPAQSAAAGATQNSPSAAKSAALTQIKIAYPEQTENRMALWIGSEKTIYDQYGTHVTPQWIASTPDTLAALLAGQVQVAQSSGADLVSAISQGADIKVIGVTAEATPYQFFVKPDINQASDLAGKKAGVSRLGSNSYAFVKGMLQALGVQDGKVAIIATGNLGATRAAFNSNAVQAFAESPVNLIGQDPSGFKKLGDPAELGVTTGAHVFAVSTKYLQQNRPALVNFLKGYEAALAYALAHPDEAKQSLGTNMQKTDPQFEQASFDEFTKNPKGDGGMSADVTPTVELMRKQTLLEASLNNAVKPDQLDPAKMIDDSLMAEVKSSPEWPAIAQGLPLKS